MVSLLEKALDDTIEEINGLFNKFYVKDPYWGQDKIIPMGSILWLPEGYVQAIFKDHVIIGNEFIHFHSLSNDSLDEIYSHAVYSMELLSSPGYFVNCVSSDSYQDWNMGANLFEVSAVGKGGVYSLKGLLGNVSVSLEEDALEVHINPFRVEVEFEHEGKEYQLKSSVVDSEDYWCGLDTPDSDVFELNIHFNLESTTVDLYPVVHGEIDTQKPIENNFKIIKA